MLQTLNNKIESYLIWGKHVHEIEHAREVWKKDKSTKDSRQMETQRITSTVLEGPKLKHYIIPSRIWRRYCFFGNETNSISASDQMIVAFAVLLLLIPENISLHASFTRLEFRVLSKSWVKKSWSEIWSPHKVHFQPFVHLQKCFLHFQCPQLSHLRPKSNITSQLRIYRPATFKSLL